MKKLFCVIFAFFIMLSGLVACKTEVESNKEVEGPIGDYVECIVDVDCDDIIESGFYSNWWYESEGTIDIDIRKFSNDNLHFENVRVELVIYLSDTFGAWRFEDSWDVDIKDWSIKGQQLTKIIDLSTGGSANFSTNIYMDYNSTSLQSFKNNLEKKPSVSASIYKRQGTITKK